jgi:CelD/BcsL family acetyltransferase involved in cellulose biosynthesis
MPVRVSVIRDQAELSKLRAGWAALLKRAHNELPFMTFTWMDTWWTHFREEGRVRDELAVHAIHDGDRLVGVFPLMLTQRRAGPLQARILSFLGADPYITELRTPLVEPDYALEVARAMADSLHQQRDWDWIHWSGIDRSSALASALERAFPMQWTSELSANVLPLPSSWEELKKGLKRNIKESLRRCYNAPKRDGLDPRLEVARTPDEVAKALQTFFQLHTLRSSVKDTIDHPDRFAKKTTRAFLEDVCARLAAENGACVFLLRLGEHVVAARVGFLLPKGLYLYYSGYDPEYSKYSVATTIVAEAMQWAIAQKLEFLHLSTGSDVSKSRWGPRETIHYDAITVAPRAHARAVHGAWELARRARALPELRAFVERFTPVRTVE